MLNIEKINYKFKKLSIFTIKYRLAILSIVVLSIVYCAGGLKGLIVDSSTDNWFMKNDPTIIEQKQMEKIFGNSDTIGVLVESDNIFTNGTLEKIRELSNELESNVPYVDEVTSITNYDFTRGNNEGIEIIDLIPKKIPHTNEELLNIKNKFLSKEILKDRMLSSNGKETWILIKLLEYPEDHYKNGYKDPADVVVALKILEIIKQDKYKSLNLVPGGIPIQNVRKSIYFGGETPRLMIIAIILAVILLIIILKSLRGVVIPLIIVISSFIIVLGIQGYAKTAFDPSVVLVPLFLGLSAAIGYSIHVFNFYQKYLNKHGKRKEAVYYAIEESGWPILFTALTTISALLTFVFIPVTVLKWIGLTSAGLIIVSYILTITIVPILLSLGKDKPVTNQSINKNKIRFINKLMDSIPIYVMNNQRKLVMISIFIVLTLCTGLFKFRISFAPKESVGLKVDYIKEIDYINKTKTGSAFSYDIIVEFQENGAAKEPINLIKLQKLSDRAISYELTKKTNSILDIIKDVHKVLNNEGSNYFTIPNSREAVSQVMLIYENAGGTDTEDWIDYDYRRYKMRVDLKEYDAQIAENEVIKLKTYAQELFPNAKIRATGSIVKFMRMTNHITIGQLVSFGISLIIISILMMIVFSSVKIGLIAMIPNVAPALVTGGIMGLMDIPLDMITVTVMPMLLGLAVDDTIHFINHCKLEYSRENNYDIAIKKTFTSVGGSLLMTSMVLIINFSAYMLSDANLLFYLGFLAIIGIFSALLADFVLTPILLKWSKAFGNDKSSLLVINESNI